VQRQPARDDEDGVDLDVVAGAGVARRKLLGGGRDPAQPIPVEREADRVEGRAVLDLDERQAFAAPSDEIDLAPANLDPPREDSPAVKPQPPGGDGLGAAAAPLGEVALQPPSARASARA
jgi:hypothetical protein